MNRNGTITRRNFVAKFMRDCGLTYEQAGSVYCTFVSVIEDAIINGVRIGIGRIGAITPRRSPPRPVTMGFRRVKRGKIERIKRTFHLDERTRWTFKVFREFEQRHHLKDR